MSDAIKRFVTAMIFFTMTSGQLQVVDFALGVNSAYAESKVNNVKTYSEEVKLIARVTEAEAGCEDEYGQRLVIDTILNRVDHENFPDTVNGVIYQKNQFSVVSNGSMKNTADTDICDLVEEELKDRTNDEVLFFQQGGYCPWGEALFKHGSHYFCGD